MSNPTQAKLVITLPNEGTQEMTLTKALTSLGRRQSNDIRLPVPTVSGQHAKIERTARGFTLTDASSTNGTFVNGQRLQPQVPHLLAKGDEVHVGQVADAAARLIFTLAPVSAVEDVTLERLNSFLTEELPVRVGENDRVLFYFAGHGIALDGDDGPTGYLVPQDGRAEDRATFLEMNELHDNLMALRCRHMLIILDCCFAGAIRWSSTRDIQTVPEVIHQERYERFIRDPAWQVITSAAYDQKALDILSGDVVGVRGDTGQKGHSPFALALFEALAGAGDVVPKGQGDGVITASELYLYLRYYVEQQAETEAQHLQTPGLWPLSKHDKGEYIFLVPGHELNLPPAPELTYENNPYRGLQSFEEEHAELFFGRTELIKQLAATVEQQPLTVVLGASSTGKSSLVKAGLIPYLGGTGESAVIVGQEEQTEADPWIILPPLRPTAAPLNALTTLLKENLAEAGDTIGLASHTRLVDVVGRWTEAHPRQKLMLVIDQLEELVTLCRDEERREQFIDLLAEVVRTCPEQVRLVVTLRTDFESRFAETGLQPYWTRFVVKAMSRAELRDVVEGPTSKRVLYFDPPNLIERLVDEVFEMPGGLPLLSFTLSTLYDKYLERRSDDRALSYDDYEDLGGVSGALSKQATAIYNALPDEAHRATMRRLILRMVSIEGGELARRPVPLAELEYGNLAENERVEAVLTALEKARLVVKDKHEGQTYAEPAHDALANGWDLVAKWRLEEEDETILLQRRVTDAASEWEASGQDKKEAGRLWHNNVRLPQVEEVLEGEPYKERGWLRRMKDYLFSRILQPEREFWLNDLELKFVQQSVDKQRRQRFITAYITLAVIAALSLITFFALIQQGIAEENAAEAQRQQQIAEKQRDTAQARALTAESELNFESNPLLSLRLSLEAWALIPENDLSTRTSVEHTILSQVRQGRLLTLGTDDVESIYVFEQCPFIIIDRADGRGEFYHTDTREITLLSGSLLSRHNFQIDRFTSEENFVCTKDSPPLFLNPEAPANRIDKSCMSSLCHRFLSQK